MVVLVSQILYLVKPVATAVAVEVKVVDRVVVTVMAATADLLQPLMELPRLVLLTAAVELVRPARLPAEEDLTGQFI